jgi:hypothetical protein
MNRMLLSMLLILSVLSLAWIVSTAHSDENKLPNDAKTILEKAESIELLSLDPTRRQEKSKDDFHGWKVLGKTILKKEDDRKTAWTAIEKGIKDNDGSAAACFNPRHGIRATHDGKTVELVICFECLTLHVYVDGKQSSALTTRSPQKALDKILTDAEVPLPKQADK